jgi:hypothetical protein
MLVHQEYITRTIRVAQVAEHLLSKHEALSSNPSTAVKKKVYITNVNIDLPKNPAPQIHLNKTNRAKGRKI